MIKRGKELIRINPINKQKMSIQLMTEHGILVILVLFTGI